MRTTCRSADTLAELRQRLLAPAIDGLGSTGHFCLTGRRDCGMEGKTAGKWRPDLTFAPNRAMIPDGFWGKVMSRVIDRIDLALGRLVFRVLGLLCAIVVLVCACVICGFVADWHPQHLVPVILFAMAGFAAAFAVRHCFSRRRRFVEFLDAMEDESPNLRRQTPRQRPPRTTD